MVFSDLPIDKIGSTVKSRKPLRIVVASSEAAPFSKSGGLADVTPALCKSLADAGHDVTMIVPYHRQSLSVRTGNCPSIHDTGLKFSIRVGGRTLPGSLYWSEIPGSSMRVLLIDQPYFFNRPGLYQEESGDYTDNCERFVFFSRAVLEVCRKLVLRPEIIHVNDWQTALVPVLLEIERRDFPEFRNSATVLTIHNLAFQGVFDQSLMPATGLDWQYFNWQQMEAHGALNLLKTGIAFANEITTVSPTYAQEIQGKEAGCGLDPTLRSRASHLTGILNGIDDQTWNPALDIHLPAKFDVSNVNTGKPTCKAHLQRRMGLPERSDVPVFSVISRMTDQKGFDLIADRADEMLQKHMQLVVLGMGEPRYESLFRELSEKHPNKVAAYIGFDESLAHQIEAGSDVFLMPSRFEPCGLNQMYSLAYGTIPLVRTVGGLADSVVNTSTETLADGTATGITFDDYNNADFFDAFERALQLYDNPGQRATVIENGMRRDSSWLNSAGEYENVYQKAIAAVAARYDTDQLTQQIVES